MEKNTARNGTGNKRLLILLFWLWSVVLYGQAFDDLIELHLTNGVVGINQDVEITLLIRNGHPLLKSGRDAPRFLLEREPQYAAFIQSSAVPESEGLHLKYVYRFTQIGSFTFSPVLQWEGQVIALAPMSVTVRPAALSEHTPFSWKLYHNGALMPAHEALEQGEQYLLFLTASFYSPTGSSPGGLPPELTRIECPVSENALLEKVSSEVWTTELNAVLTSGEEHILAAFNWTPLHAGTSHLPEAQIFFASGSKAVSSTAVYEVLPQNDSSISEERSQTAFHAAFIKEDQHLTIDNRMVTAINEKQITAQKIAEYRQKESRLLFPYSIHNERKDLEISLHIVQSFPIYPRILRLLTLGGTVLCIMAAVYCGIRKKRFVMLVCVTAALFCGGGSFMLFRHALRKTGVCTAVTAITAMYRIPETAGSIIYNLALGECVIIMRKTTHWYYIQTVSGISGWVHCDALTVL